MRYADEDRQIRFFEAAKRVAARMTRWGAGAHVGDPDDRDLVTAYLDLISHGEPSVPAGPGGYQPRP